jgi:hypothetical protein
LEAVVAVESLVAVAGAVASLLDDPHAASAADPIPPASSATA